MYEYISKLFIKVVLKASNGQKKDIYYARTRFKLTKDGLHTII